MFSHCFTMSVHSQKLQPCFHAVSVIHPPSVLVYGHSTALAGYFWFWILLNTAVRLSCLKNNNNNKITGTRHQCCTLYTLPSATHTHKTTPVSLLCWKWSTPQITSAQWRSDGGPCLLMYRVKWSWQTVYSKTSAIVHLLPCISSSICEFFFKSFFNTGIESHEY